MPADQREAFVPDTLAVQQRSVLPCAVQCVVMQLPDGGRYTKLQQYVQSLPLLTALDLRGCQEDFVSDSFLCAVADAHPWLQRLYLPWQSSVPQSTLDAVLHCSFCVKSVLDIVVNEMRLTFLFV